MATTITLIVFVAFYLLYYRSNKMPSPTGLHLEQWAGGHRRLCGYCGVALLLLALGLSCRYWGWGSGSFTFVIILMTLASLIVLLAPMGLLKIRNVGVLLGISFICELFIL